MSARQHALWFVLQWQRKVGGFKVSRFQGSRFKVSKIARFQGCKLSLAHPEHSVETFETSETLKPAKPQNAHRHERFAYNKSCSPSATFAELTAGAPPTYVASVRARCEDQIFVAQGAPQRCSFVVGLASRLQVSPIFSSVAHVSALLLSGMV
jgi:hypothetical protein